MEHYECDGDCIHDSDEWCGAASPSGEYTCTRQHGHTGPHVACERDGDCNISSWESKKRVSLKKEAGPIGPIKITIGAVEVEIPGPGPEGDRVFLGVRHDGSRVANLTPEDLKRLIRALVMAANLQRPPNPVECGECGDWGYQLDDDDDTFPIRRCDECEQFASDYDAWLSIIPDDTRLAENDEEEE